MKIDDLIKSKVNSEVADLRGWVSSIRDHGGLVFIELRDSSSKIQIVLDSENVDIDTFKSEYYISVNGTYIKRDKHKRHKYKLRYQNNIHNEKRHNIYRNKTQ